MENRYLSSSSSSFTHHELEQWKQSMRAQEDDQVLLHQTVVSSKKQAIEAQYERLAKQRAFIRHEKRKLVLQTALLESEKERFEASLQSDWFVASAFPSVHDRRLTLDVGGQLFEIASSVATKDTCSFLAALVQDDAPIAQNECGCYRFDRDWFLFRYVLHFLRDGLLPHDPKILRALYLESEFWKLESLRKAIEVRNMEILQLKTQQQQQEMNELTTAAGAALMATAKQPKGTSAAHFNVSLLSKLKQSAMLPDVHSGSKKEKDPSAWWMEPPSWWGEKKEPKLASVAALAKKAEAAAKGNKSEGKKEKDKEPDAWWKSTVYKGKDYTQILSPSKPAKETTKAEAAAAAEEHQQHPSPRPPLLLHSTWASSMNVTQ